MRKLSAGLLLLLGLACPALAQTKFTMPPPAGVTVIGIQVVSSCGSASGLSAGNTAFVAMDTTGALCTNASSGGTVTANQGTAAAAAGAWPFYGVQGATALSSTNGWYTNLLQGNAVLSQTNPIFSSVTDGTNKAAVKPASTAAAATDPALVTQLSPLSPGIIALGQATKANSVPVTFASDQDPCSYAQKSSKAINVTSATTTSLVSVSGSTTVYVCGFSVTINEILTTATTALFEYGTGAACTSPTVLTGTYGGGGITAAAPITVSYGNGGATVFASAASAGICLLSAGTTVNIQGTLTYVQQ